MPIQSNPIPTREYVSVSQLAEDILGLSRARLYELIERGAMPMPVYDLRSRRPIYTREQQEQALAVRNNGVGIDGQAVVFYRKNRHASIAPLPRTNTRARPGRFSTSEPMHAELVSGLQSLGITNANEQVVAAALIECFPHGTNNQQEADILRMLFRYLRRKVPPEKCSD